MWETQAENFTTSKKLNVEFCLLGFIVAKIVTWKFQVGESTNSRYNMILGRYLLTALGLDLKFYENVIIGGELPYKGYSTSMVGVSNCDFKSRTDKPLNRKNTL